MECKNTIIPLKCCIHAASLMKVKLYVSSHLASKNALSCVFLSDRDGLQVQYGDRQPNKHTSTPGSAAGSACVFKSRADLLAAAQHDCQDDVRVAGTRVQPLNVPSLGEGSAEGGVGRKRGRENASVPTTEEGDWEQPMSLNLD